MNFFKKYLTLGIIGLMLGLFCLINPVSAAISVKSTSPIKVTVLTDKIAAPENYEALTPLYEIKLDSKKLAKNKTFSATINYTSVDNNYKRVFFFDKQKNIWRPLPTYDNPRAKTVRVEIPFTYVRLAVFSNNDILTVGQASWYSHKGGLLAASPDFSLGSVLRVYNLDNGKHVDVTVNDYGPQRNIHPTRVVDLDKQAFVKIAKAGAGTINIRIEVLHSNKPDLNQDLAPAKEPIITAWSAVVVRETDGRILWNKDGSKVSPLASLTKLVAAQVFLDTKPTLSKIVTYKKQDETYNYQYCKPGEAAELQTKEGDTLTLSDLLYSALVGSANNAVESLVRNSGLTRTQFIARMNNKVKEWGATSTSFIEPTGLSEKNVSSPADYAIITKKAYTNPLLQKISTTYKYSFATSNTKIKHTLTNTDKIIASGKYDIIGSKTGYLNEARYCLMTRIKSRWGNLIAVNFGSASKNDNFSDNQKLLDYGLRLLKD